VSAELSVAAESAADSAAAVVVVAAVGVVVTAVVVVAAAVELEESAESPHDANTTVVRERAVTAARIFLAFIIITS